MSTRPCGGLSRWLGKEVISLSGVPGVSEGVEAITAGTAQVLPTRYDFSRHRRVLDLGGGTGSFLMAVLRRHPDLACTLFEW
jgi:spermidine synthase